MIQLDTVKIEIPKDDVLKVNKDYFREIRDTDYFTGQILTDYRIRRDIPKPLGISSIRFDDNDLRLELSAKILKDDYFNMITSNSIERVSEIINETGFVKIKPNSFINNALCRKADITKNLKMSKPVDEYINALYTFDNTNKYRVKDYDFDGIEFTKNVKTKRLQDRLIFYDKAKEILKNKELLKYVNPKQFNGVLRFENNLRANDMFRRLTGIQHTGDILLREVLESKENPCLINFKNVFGKNPVKPIQACFTDDELFILESDIPFKQKKNQLGLRAIVKYCKSDYKLMKQYIEKHCQVKATKYRQLAELTKTLKEMKNTDVRISENNYMSEILQAIETA